jgi:hypothetical protein
MKSSIQMFYAMLLLAGFACKDNPPEVIVHRLRLRLTKVGIVDASLKIDITDPNAPRTIVLKKDHRTILETILAHQDTTVTDSTLLRARRYSYKSYLLQFDTAIDSSENVIVSTLDSSGINISTVDVQVKEATVKVTMDDHNTNRTFLVQRDGQSISSGYLTGPDTVIDDRGLLPASTHQYKVFRLADSSIVDSSTAVVLTTLDTTSHAFIWQVDTLGLAFSHARDVAIISQSETWVVGEFCLNDSSRRIDNLARWDGSTWTYDRVYFSVCDSTVIGVGSTVNPCTAIFALSRDNVWITDGAVFVNWDGFKFRQVCRYGNIIDGELLKLWGTSNTNMFAVGQKGKISHYDGASWQKMESGTDIDLLDVWGSPDGSVVWACGWTDFKPTILLRYQNGVWNKAYQDEANLYSYSQDSLSGPVKSVWTNSSNRLFALTWFDLYQLPTNTRGEGQVLWGMENPNIWASEKIRGTAINNLAAVSYPGLIWHYNGLSWESFDYLKNSHDYLRNVDVTGDQIVAVGDRNYDGIHYYGVVYRGRR